MSRNSAPYRFISSTYNSVVTKLEGGNVNQIEVVHSANKACHNWMFVLIYRIQEVRPISIWKKSYRSLSEKTRRLR